MSEECEWISVNLLEDGTMISDDGRVTEDGGKTYRKATDEEMKCFKNGE